MILRTTTFVVLIGTVSRLGVAADSAHVNPWMMQQAMEGDKTAQMMMMMGGGMGGGGGGSDAKYESKAADLQKAIEQPAKEIQKRADDQIKAMQTANDKLSSEAAKFFQANTPKDEKIDEKLAAQISAPPPSNTKAMDADTNDVIAQTKALADAEIATVSALGRGFIKETPTPQKVENTMEARLGWLKNTTPATGGGLAAATEARTPASQAPGDVSALNHTPGANGGMSIPNPISQRGFAPGLIHNPPAGF